MILINTESPVFIPAFVLFQVCYYTSLTLHVYILECVYGLLITAVPFLIMSVLNCMILRTLLHASPAAPISRDHSNIKREFTLILLGVSTCFVCLNLPYFIVWCCSMVSMVRQVGSELDTFKAAYQDELVITKTLFCCNYCVNFFLYCFSGNYYKNQLKRLLFSKFNVMQHGASRHSSAETQITSPTIASNIKLDSPLLVGNKSR